MHTDTYKLQHRHTVLLSIKALRTISYATQYTIIAGGYGAATRGGD